VAFFLIEHLCFIQVAPVRCTQSVHSCFSTQTVLCTPQVKDSRSTTKECWGTMPLTSFPLIRDLSYCRQRDYIEASKEVTVTVLCSTVALWLGLIFAWVSPTYLVSRYLTTFVLSGEFLLLSTALVGPIFYIITKRYGSDLPAPSSRHFLQGWFFTLLALCVCLIAAAIFGYNRISSPGTEIERGQLSFGPMVTLSLIIFVISTITLFLVITIGNFMEDGAVGLMHDDTQSYVREFQGDK
jgi:hypothetical protein